MAEKGTGHVGLRKEPTNVQEQDSNMDLRREKKGMDLLCVTLMGK